MAVPPWVRWGEAYGAVRAGRRTIGIELKTSYYKQAVLNMAQATTAPLEEQIGLPFDLEETEATSIAEVALV